MTQYAGAVASEIDRLVIRGHAVAAAADQPEPLAGLTVHTGLLSTAAIVLLAAPLVRDDVGRIMPYLPTPVADALIENNASEEVIERRGDELSLTDQGKVLARAMVDLQEDTIASLWAGSDDAMATVTDIADPIVRAALSGDAPSMPSAFHLFAAVTDRPTLAGRVLRTITAMRYWRADAHRAALHAVDLDPQQAHALNRLWDVKRGVERVGQGREEPGKRGVAALEQRGLADAGAITQAGVDLRETVETDTDVRTEPIYQGLNATGRDELLAALKALPS